MTSERPTEVTKRELGHRLTLVTALFGILLIVPLAFSQLRPRVVADAVGPPPLAFGDPAADTRVVAFVSPTCSHCAAFELGPGKDLYRRAEAGGLYYAVYPLALERGREVDTRAFFCAFEQGKLPAFVARHYLTYRFPWRPDPLALARRSGADPAAFGRCLDAPRTKRRAAASLEWQGELGVVATPTFFIKRAEADAYARVRGNRGPTFWNRVLGDER